MIIVPIEPMQLMDISKIENQMQMKPIAGSAQGLPFENILKDAISVAEQTQAVANTDAVNVALGNVDDIAQVQINTLKAKTAVQTAVQLTSRVVSCYKEIMQMSV